MYFPKKEENLTDQPNYDQCQLEFDAVECFSLAVKEKLVRVHRNVDDDKFRKIVEEKCI